MKKYLIICAAAIIACTTSCGKSSTSVTGSEPVMKDRYVSARDGLNMRDKPDLKAAKIGTVGFNTRVTFIEETGAEFENAGMTGKWTLISDENGKKGWVFGGFLAWDPCD